MLFMFIYKQYNDYGTDYKSVRAAHVPCTNNTVLYYVLILDIPHKKGSQPLNQVNSLNLVHLYYRTSPWS